MYNVSIHFKYILFISANETVLLFYLFLLTVVTLLCRHPKSTGFDPWETADGEKHWPGSNKSQRGRPHPVDLNPNEKHVFTHILWRKG